MYSFIIVIVLQFIAMATANLLIPQYGNVITYFGIPNSLIGFADSVFILASAGMSLLWGYYTDRIDRNRVVMIGAFLWSIGTTFSAFIPWKDMFGFQMLVLARAVTGAGMGCVIPIALSIVGDLIPADERSSWFGTLAILSSISTGAGQGMASFLAPLTPMGWQFPFLVISIASIILIVLMFFIKIPGRGTHEEELESLQKLDMEYMYQLTGKDIISILKKKTNAIIFLQGFLAIIPGTLVVYFLTTMFSDANIGLFKVLDESQRIQVSSIFAAFVGIGYLIGNSVLAQAGDQLYKKNRRGRVILSAISLSVSVPLCIAFVFFAPKLGSSFTLPEDANMFTIVIEIFKQKPESIAYVIFAFAGSFFSAAPIANRGAILVDVNLPEHRGTANSLFNLSEQLGKGITLALSYVMLTIFSSYGSMIIFAALFWLPAGWLFFRARKTVARDMDEKSMILRERTQMSFIDYIFELEIVMDQGIQLIHDLNKDLGTNNKAAMQKLEKSIKIFKGIESRAEKRPEMGDLKTEAHLKAIKALMLESDLKSILKMEKEGTSGIEDDIKQLKFKIAEQWEASDLGKIEVLYDDAYFKFISARLNRKYDLFLTIKNINDAIDTLDRVELLAEERLINEDIRKLTKNEQTFQDRVMDLLTRTRQFKENLKDLKSHLEEIINLLAEKGVSENDFRKMITLSSEYEVPYSEILVESLEKKRSKRAIEKIVSEIDRLFDRFDKQNKSQNVMNQTS